jgi:hypothetical protein
MLTQTRAALPTPKNAPPSPDLRRAAPVQRPGRWRPGLLLALLLTAATRPALATCYTPSDQTAGWKRAAIPDGAPALAVSDSLAGTPRDFIEQFRAGESAMVWLGGEHSSMALGGHHPGRIEYVFRVDGAQWQVLQIQLAASLAGEKVDVIAYGASGAVPLWLERRAAGSSLAIEWSLPGVYAVAVSFHHHLRERPVVTSWQAGLRAKVSETAWVPAGFRQPGSLYYYHPGGRTLILCNEPFHDLAVRRESLTPVNPTPVKLVPR